MSKKQLNKEEREEFNGELQAIFKGGKINAINWGADSENSGWNVWTVEQRLKYSMELASAMNQAADVMQKERNNLLDANKALVKQVEQAEESMNISKNIMTNTIIQSNEKHMAFADEIRKLKEEIAVLKAFNDAGVNKL